MADRPRTEPNPPYTAWRADDSTEKRKRYYTTSRKWKSVAARCLLSLAMAAGAGTAAVRAAEPIRIGSIFDLTGGLNIYASSKVKPCILL
jgi:hypothetical protein